MQKAALLLVALPVALRQVLQLQWLQHVVLIPEPVFQWLVPAWFSVLTACHPPAGAAGQRMCGYHAVGYSSQVSRVVL